MRDNWDWVPHTVAVWQRWSWGRYVAFKTNFYGSWLLSADSGQTVIFSDEHLQAVMEHAKALATIMKVKNDGIR